MHWKTFTLPVSTNNTNVWWKNAIQELNYSEQTNELNNTSITFCFFFILCGKKANLRLILSMHIIALWRIGANADFIWSFCFDLYARWTDFFQAKMLIHVIKFENCFTLSISIKDFCIVKDKLTLFFVHRLCKMYGGPIVTLKIFFL